MAKAVEAELRPNASGRRTRPTSRRPDLRARLAVKTGLTALVSLLPSRSRDRSRSWPSLKIAERSGAGSSVKFLAIARGEADIYPRFGPTMEWDTAAGQAVLEAAGGSVVDAGGKPLRYGKTAHGLAQSELHRLGPKG